MFTQGTKIKTAVWPTKCQAGADWPPGLWGHGPWPNGELSRTSFFCVSWKLMTLQDTQVASLDRSLLESTISVSRTSRLVGIQIMGTGAYFCHIHFQCCGQHKSNSNFIGFMQFLFATPGFDKYNCYPCNPDNFWSLGIQFVGHVHMQIKQARWRYS